jgi:hypothetical protein
MRTLRLFPYGTCEETQPGRYSFHLPQNLGDWAESIDEGQSIQPSFLVYNQFDRGDTQVAPGILLRVLPDIITAI